MSNTEQIKTDDAIFNAALSVLGEWPATRECSMRAKMTMAADMQDRIMDTVRAMLTDKKRSIGGKLAADKRWAKQKAKVNAEIATAVGAVMADTTPAALVPGVAAQAEPKRRGGRPRKAVAEAVPVPAAQVATSVPPPLPEMPPVPAAAPAVPPIPPMPSATPPAPSANPFGTLPQ